MLSYFAIAMDMFVKTLTSREDPLFSSFVIADNLILLSIISSSWKPPAAVPEKLMSWCETPKANNSHTSESLVAA